MSSVWGKLTATTPGPAAPPVTGDGAAPAAEADKSLPDATKRAGTWAFLLFLLAIAVALAFNGFGWTGNEFDPSKNSEANFALFAGFYVGAQVIERLLEFIAPMLPPGKPVTWLAGAGMTITDDAARAAQIKADRAKIVLGVAAVFGVLASCLLGLFFLKAIGMSVSHTVDSILTGITIAAGTKPLHDFITSLQNKSAPTTGTGTTA